MVLTDLNLQGLYKNYSSLLETKFFIPVLSEAKIYLRVASYSPGSSIMELIPGLSSMINNGVEMKVVITIHLPEHDYDANNIILDVLMEVGSIPEIQCNDPTKTFYKLLSAGNIDIKFMICKKVITPENFGIVDDHDHNSVSYSFLPNETNEEGEINREEIRVSRSWINEENCYVQDYYSKFYSYWEGNFSSKDFILYDVPEVIKQKVGSALEGKGKIVAKSKIKLRPYQEKAVKYFTDMNFKAILEMATGTGKTFIALNCAKALYEKEGERFTIIVVPTENLMYQWKNEWKDFFGVVPYLYKKEKSLSFLRYHNLFDENGVMIITYNSLSKIASESNFLSIIGEGNLIIADEVHWMGAPKFSRVMLNNFQWRLGLSATPERMFDEEGTNMVLDYFEKNEFKYSLQDAIVDGYLSPFSYFPYFCKLSQEELSEYENLTKKTLYFKKGSNEDESSPLENLLFKRAKVAKKAICKNSIFDKIIESLYNSKKA